MAGRGGGGLYIKKKKKKKKTCLAPPSTFFFFPFQIEIGSYRREKLGARHHYRVWSTGIGVCGARDYTSLDICPAQEEEDEEEEEDERSIPFFITEAYYVWYTSQSSFPIFYITISKWIFVDLFLNHQNNLKYRIICRCCRTGSLEDGPLQTPFYWYFFFFESKR